MSDIWYWNVSEGDFLMTTEGDKWIKLKWRRDLSGLDDVFEFMEDYIEKRINSGMTISWYYGCMSTSIEKGELMREDEYITQKKYE